MTRQDYDRQVFMDECRRQIGKPYLWGGQGELGDGIDCSGIVVEGFRACGMFTKRQDSSARNLYSRYWKGHSEPPKEGALVFWGKDWDDPESVYHVAICITPFHVITADGGGSTVTTEEAAKEKKAFVRILPIDHRGTNYRVIDPFNL